MKIQLGDPVILTDAKGFGKYGFRKGIKGTANSLTNVEGKDLIMFMPTFELKTYWMALDRFELDEEALKQRSPVDEALDEEAEDDSSN